MLIYDRDHQKTTCLCRVCLAVGGGCFCRRQSGPETTSLLLLQETNLNQHALKFNPLLISFFTIYTAETTYRKVHSSVAIR